MRDNDASRARDALNAIPPDLDRTELIRVGLGVHVACGINDFTWLDRLRALVARFPEYAVGADLPLMSTAELWGLYRFLSRIAEGT